MVNPLCFFAAIVLLSSDTRRTICLFVLSVYVCQNNKQNQNHGWYLAPMKNKPVILRHLVDMWFIHLGLRPRWINNVVFVETTKVNNFSNTKSRFELPLVHTCTHTRSATWPLFIVPDVHRTTHLPISPLINPNINFNKIAWAMSTMSDQVNRKTVTTVRSKSVSLGNHKHY